MNGLFKSKINSLHSCLMEKAKLTYQASPKFFSIK